MTTFRPDQIVQRRGDDQQHLRLLARHAQSGLWLALPLEPGNRTPESYYDSELEALSPAAASWLQAQVEHSWADTDTTMQAINEMMDGLQLTIHMRFSLETQLQRLHEQLDKLATQEAERRQYQQTLEALHPLGREE
jgi:hypothetical protein